MKLKKGDNVVVITGKDKGKKGVITEVFPRAERVTIDGVNIAKVSEKPRTKSGKGQIVSRAMPIHASNVMIVDPKKGERTRVAVKSIGGKNIRVAKKSDSELK